MSYFGGKCHYKDNGTQNYWLFQPTYRYFRKIGNTNHISAWKSKEVFDESIKSHATSDNNLVLSLNYIDFIPRIKFGGQCLKQDKVIFTHKRVAKNLWPFKESTDFTLVNFLLGTVNLSKNSDFEKHKYFGYGFGIQARESFSLSDGSGFGKNVIIFVAHMISSGHVDSRKEKS